MQEISIHPIPLLIAAIIQFVIGAVWYSPQLFGRPWSEMTGCSDKQMKNGMGKAMLVSFIVNFVLAFVLIHAIIYAGAKTFAQGAAVGFFNWLGFIAGPTLSGTLFEHRPIKLFWINVGWQFISLLLVGGYLATWY